jgi:hypothetical protein
VMKLLADEAPEARHAEEAPSPDDERSEYERERDAKVARNRQIVEELFGKSSIASANSATKPTSDQKQIQTPKLKPTVLATRRSDRIRTGKIITRTSPINGGGNTTTESAQCAKCGKWRRFQECHRTAVTDDSWECKYMFWDPERASCVAAQEQSLTDEDNVGTTTYSDTNGKTVHPTPTTRQPPSLMLPVHLLKTSTHADWNNATDSSGDDFESCPKPNVRLHYSLIFDNFLWVCLSCRLTRQTRYR